MQFRCGLLNHCPMALKGVLKKALLFKIIKWLLFLLQGVALTMYNCPHLEMDCTLRFYLSETQIDFAFKIMSYFCGVQP